MTRLRAVVRGAGFVAFALGVALAWMWVLPPAAAVQPMEFNHAKHLPIACATCHTGVAHGARAGLPAGTLCTKCHATAPAAAREDHWARIADAPAAPWVPRTRLPADVWFSHDRHAGAGRLECASCHGDIGTRTAPAPRNPVRLDMSTCLACHRRENVTEDCASCHR